MLSSAPITLIKIGALRAAGRVVIPDFQHEVLNIRSNRGKRCRPRMVLPTLDLLRNFKRLRFAGARCRSGLAPYRRDGDRRGHHVGTQPRCG